MNLATKIDLGYVKLIIITMMMIIIILYFLFLVVEFIEC